MPDKYYANGGIKSKERSKKYGEVFTPEWLVRDMLDMLAQENIGEPIWFLEDTDGEHNML